MNNILLQQRATTALRNLFVADALAMPVHWFYKPLDIDAAFPGGIRQFEDAPRFHPSSIMALHSTAQGGRGPQSQGRQQVEIVGDVILRGKREYWGLPNGHYHQGMRAGENTLNAHCARVLMRCLNAHQHRYDKEQWLDAYIAFMTAYPPMHPDTYAESYHRGFFAKLQQGQPKTRCGALTHDTASIGGLVTIAPLYFALRLQGMPLDQIQAVVREHLFLTHPDESLARVCASYVTLLEQLLLRDEGQDPMPLLAACGRAVGIDLKGLLATGRGDRDIVGHLFSSACYISDAWPSVLYLAAKYWQEPTAGLLANANVGGDNVHRGAVLGVLFGLCNPSVPAGAFTALWDAPILLQEITELVRNSP